jgi:signal transduction histidine kinase/CheY-like chemotaxis protein/HAMP domain-containing protein
MTITGILFVAVLFSLFGLSKNNQQIDEMKTTSTEAELALEIESHLLEGQLVFKEFLNNGDGSLINEFNKENSDMLQHIKEIEALTISDSRMDLITRIKLKVDEYNFGFEQFSNLDDERAEYYDKLSGYGASIVDSMLSIDEIAKDLGQMDIELLNSEATNYLLQARLHAMKFFTFHQDDEYLLYLEDFDTFISVLDTLYNLKRDNEYKIEYTALRSSANDYKTGMAELYTIIKDIDLQVEKMNVNGEEVLQLVSQIITSVQTDQNILTTEVKSQSTMLTSTSAFIGFLAIVFTFFIAGWMIRTILVPIDSLKNTFESISTGDVDLDFRLPIKNDDEIGAMSKSFNDFMIKLKVLMDDVNLQNWTKTAQNELNKVIREMKDVKLLTQAILTYLCKYIDAEVGVMYLADEENLSQVATYSYTNRKGIETTVNYGEGLVGQCAVERNAFILSDIPDDYMNIQSALGNRQPNNIIVFPCEYENDLKAVIELGTFKTLSEQDLNLLRILSDSIAISIHSLVVQIQLQELLDKTMNQSEELQMQQEELRQSNEELEEQTRALKDSEQKLQAQQEELRVSNEELEQRAKQLEIQKKALDDNNKEILIKQQEVIEKAEALELANTYKSEFLANMSHELRTPLNSILVLSQLLSSKKKGEGLSDKEIEFANTINSSGKDLLTLINDVLDLSKVEAGHLDISYEEILLSNLLVESERMFTPLTDLKSIEFHTQLDKELPEIIKSDSIRIQQIIKNLVSNAIKFTDKGNVTLSIRKPSEFECDAIGCKTNEYVAIEVSDTGLGIPDEKQQIIFEAFRQSDGTTSRKYGGTGLGLTISRELASLLGGKILLESTMGEGSKFVFIFPMNKAHTIEMRDLTEAVATPKETIEPFKEAETVIAQTFDKVTSNTLLVIEDDETFANILADLAIEKGFECVVAHSAKDGFDKAIELRPTAIVLDLGLPDADGMDLAKKLGRADETRHIPIHIVSGKEEVSSTLPNSIIGFLKKPVDIKSIYKTLAKIESISKETESLLIIGRCADEDFSQFTHLGKMSLEQYINPDEAIERLENEVFSCIVLDAEVEHNNKGYLNKITEIKGSVPIIIYSEKELSDEDLKEFDSLSDSIILKSPKSNDRLKDEVSLFLHGMQTTMDEHQNASGFRMTSILDDMSEKVRNDDFFQGKKILIVDDDERNVFALSNVLAQHNFVYEVASNGLESIQVLKADDDFDLILMDIMMPKMDGYEAIKSIRQLETCKDIPIIALTAKAMQDDRRKCIEAGANDYMTKPLNIEKLISALKVWLA